MDMSTERLALTIERLDRLNRHLTFRIFRLSKLLESEGAGRLAGSHINLTSYRMMMIIDLFGQITVSDLSRIIVTDRAQVSRAANDLIERGYLQANPDKTSKRKKLLSLTHWGQAQFEGLLALFNNRLAEIDQLLTEEELSGLWASIDKISDYLAEQIDGREKT